MARRLARVGRECVACGCCVKVCPKGAVSIVRGIIARVEEEKCVGCGVCAAACPKKCLTLR